MRDSILTPVPEGFKITRLPARVAIGARKPRNGSCHGVQTTSAIFASADRRALLARASRKRPTV